MKKIVITLIFAVMAAMGLYAQGNMSVGVDYNYSTKGGASGLGVQLEYEFVKNFRVAPELIYTFSSGDHGHFTNVNLNLQYVVGTGSGFELYPMAGLAYVNGGGADNCGVNVGCGAEYGITSGFSIYTEQTFQMVKHCTRFIPAFGVKFSF